MKFVLAATIICFTTFVHAQHKYDNLPFKADSVQSFNNQLVQEGFIENIKNSRADFEIRVYTTPFKSNNSPISVFKCKGDTCIIENYNCYKSKDSVLEKNFDNIGINKEGQFLQRLKHTYKSKININKYLIELGKYNFFSLKDQSDLLKSFRKNKSYFVDPCSNQTECFDIPLLIEIKMKSKFRNFKMSSIDYFVDNIPQHIKEFENNHYIKLLLKNIFNTHSHIYEKK